MNRMTSQRGRKKLAAHPGDIASTFSLLEAALTSLIARRLASDAFSWRVLGDTIVPRINMSERINLLRDVLRDAGLSQPKYMELCSEITALNKLRVLSAHFIRLDWSEDRFEGMIIQKGKIERVTFTRSMIVAAVARIISATALLSQVHKHMPKADFETPSDPVVDGIMADIKAAMQGDTNAAQSADERRALRMALERLESLADSFTSDEADS